MPDFNQAAPPAKVTNPDGIAIGAQFPRHVHKYAGPNVINDYLVVNSDDELAAALDQGYALQPQLAPPAEKKAKADKADKGDKGDK